MTIALPKNTIDETGHRYGRLVVLEYAGTNNSRNSMWYCLCDCGTGVIASSKRLRNGRSVSCGCYRANPEIRRAARMKTPARRRKAIARMGGEARRSKI
jgi:hypothetical protein